MNAKTYIPVAIAAALIVVSGAVHAYWIGTFGSVNNTEVLQTFAQRLPDVPLDVGDWEGTEQEAMDARERHVAGINAALSRVYRNRVTGQSLSVLIVTGNFRSVARHTPDECWVAAGFSMLNPPIHYTIKTGDSIAGDVETYTTVFTKDTPTNRLYQRVFWTWSYDGTWQAPELPTMALVGHPALYKMYLVTEVPGAGQDISQNQAVAFLREFKPILDEALFPSTPDSPAETPVAGNRDSTGTPAG